MSFIISLHGLKSGEGLHIGWNMCSLAYATLFDVCPQKRKMKLTIFRVQLPKVE
jgi:hypothetical protein